jgi:hypothetical protein
MLKVRALGTLLLVDALIHGVLSQGLKEAGLRQHLTVAV